MAADRIPTVNLCGHEDYDDLPRLPLVEKCLANRTLTYTGVFASRLALTVPETRVIFRGRLSPDRGSLLYEVVVDLPRDSQEPILKLPPKQGVILQGRIVSANFMTYSEMSERRLCLKLDRVKHVLIAQPGVTAGQSPSPDAARLAAENERLKGEVERLGALCRAHGVDPRSAPPDPKKPTFGSVEAALNAMPQKFFEFNQDRDLKQAYLAHTMGGRFVRVRGTATLDRFGMGRFQVAESPNITAVIRFAPDQPTPPAGDQVDVVMRMTFISFSRPDPRGPLKNIRVEGEVVGVDKPQ